MPKPTTKPEWASAGSGITEPSAAKKSLGWIKEKAPYQYFNWLFYWIWKWIDWVDTGMTGADIPVSGTDARKLDVAIAGAGVSAFASAAAAEAATGISDNAVICVNSYGLYRRAAGSTDIRDGKYILTSADGGRFLLEAAGVDLVADIAGV